jgi:hypothetical protein
MSWQTGYPISWEQGNIILRSLFYLKGLLRQSLSLPGHPLCLTSSSSMPTLRFLGNLNNISGTVAPFALAIPSIESPRSWLSDDIWVYGVLLRGRTAIRCLVRFCTFYFIWAISHEPWCDFLSHCVRSIALDLAFLTIPWLQQTPAMSRQPPFPPPPTDTHLSYSPSHTPLPSSLPSSPTLYPPTAMSHLSTNWCRVRKQWLRH